MAEWIKNHLGIIFMGFAGATVTSLVPSNKPLGERVVSFFVGIILCVSLAPHTANFLTNGNYTEVFGFIYGMGGITIAKMILKAIDKRSKLEIENRTGVKLDDDNS